MSPATVQFFENAFNETRFTKSIKNLDWKLNTSMKVVGQVSQVITEKSANETLNSGTKGKQNVQNRQVVAKMLPIEWVFASYGDNKNVGFRELIIALSESNFGSLFSTELVITLNEHMW